MLGTAHTNNSDDHCGDDDRQRQTTEIGASTPGIGLAAE
jgi:hypothetical protein